MHRNSYGYLPSPIGRIKIESDKEKIINISFANEDDFSFDQLNSNIINKTKNELVEYFEGKRERFSIPLSYEGTDFQKLIWKSLEQIPFGETITYKELAAKIGRPKAYRAVGTAVGKNPFPIINPCHRVLGSNGKLGGYSGGIEIKKFLLILENKP